MSRKSSDSAAQRGPARSSAATVLREYGPFPGVQEVAGVTYDGQNVWMATGARLVAFDAASGQTTRTLDTVCDAGTAFDGKHLFQLAKGQIRKLDPETGEVLAVIPTPQLEHASGLTWAEGTLWVGSYRSREIHQIDAGTGAVLRTVVSNRFVTGVTWVEGELWHGTLEQGESELRQVRPETGEVLTRLVMPEGVLISGLESDGSETFFCGGAQSGKVRVVRRPQRA